MPDFRLTVVMSCFNQAATLRQAVESVLQQRTDFPFRLVITDDCSRKDNSRDIIRAYAEKYPERVVALLNEENGRYLKNVLRAVYGMRTDYFTLLDADDYWTDLNYLNDAVSFLEGHPRHTVYFQNVQWQSDDGRSGLQQPQEEEDFDLTFPDFIRGPQVFPQTTGAVFRNVIFRDGIPPIMSDAVGTIHERAYDGDVFRFLQHLERGVAHFRNRIAGVYRLSGIGVFGGMPRSKLHMIQAQCFVDYETYFGKETDFFAGQARKSLSLAVDALPEDMASGVVFDEECARCLASVVSFLSRNRELSVGRTSWGGLLRRIRGRT